MEHITGQAVTDYLRRTLRPETGRLHEMEEYARENYIPIIQREAGRFLSVLVAMLKPKRILEMGTAIGYSALLMANACEAQITTVERDEEMFCQAIENISACGMKDRIRLLHGDAETEVRNLPGGFDFIFIDAAKGQSPVHFALALEKLAPGGVIVTDNVLYRGTVAGEGEVGHKHRTIITRLREFLDMLCKDERFDTAILPIGDGMAITKVKESKETEKCL
ncbi:MAG: O-methyltransferase [Clostridia bacterium]|nr:O-methyltransferase [Clostridia bacterium]